MVERSRATRMTPQGVGRRNHLSRVSAALSQEFADRLDVVAIERVAAEEVAALEEARVRDFIPILAMRRGRLRLQERAQGAGEGLGEREEVDGEGGMAARVHDRDEVRQKGSV